MKLLQTTDKFTFVHVIRTILIIQQPMFTLDVFELTRVESGKVMLTDTDAKPVFQHL